MKILKLSLVKTSFKKIRNLPKEVFWYILYGFFCLLFFIYARFPYGKLQENLLAKLRENSSLNIVVGEKSFKFPLGFRWKNVSISKDEDISQGPPFKIDEVTMGLNIIQLMILRKSFDIESKAFGGEIEGNLLIRGNGYWIRARTLKGLDLNKIYSFKKSTGSKLAGEMDSSFNLYIPQQGLSLSNGSTSINLKDLKLENFWPMLPKVALSEFKGEIKFLKGRGAIKRLEATGDDIKITGRGSLDLSNSFTESRVNINLKVTTKGKSILGKIISAIARSSGKTFIPVTITGNISKPLIRIAGVALE